MNADGFIEIIDAILVPFFTQHPDMILYMDNHPVHRSKKVTDHFAIRGINTLPTPANSPDMNPIEKVWYSLKHFIYQRRIPSTEAELINNIDAYWHAKVSADFCRRFIHNLETDIYPNIIEARGHYAMG